MIISTASTTSCAIDQEKTALPSSPSLPKTAELECKLDTVDSAKEEGNVEDETVPGELYAVTGIH